MSINLFELEKVLEGGIGKHYDSLTKTIKDYEAEHKRILEKRKNEFKNSPRYFGIGPHIWSEKNYPYFNRLTTKQKYYIDNGKVGIRTDEFFLPVTGSTDINKVEIYSSAKIPCGCWDDVRKKIAEENGLMVGDNEFCASVASAFKIIGKTIDAKDAEERLAAALQKDFNSKLELAKR